MAMVALNYYTEESALSLKAVTTMIDWETIGLLLGMMIMVGIISHTGLRMVGCSGIQEKWWRDLDFSRNFMFCYSSAFCFFG